MKIGYLILFILLFSQLALAKTLECHPVLWPVASFDKSRPEREAAISLLQANANKALRQSIKVVPTLASAGKINLQDRQLLATRQAFQTIDHAAVLALIFMLTNRSDYLQKSKDILLTWAKVNQPTGHPIDETRIAGFIWAYDLIYCYFSKDEQTQIRHYLEIMRNKKRHWQCGPHTRINNHRIHQLKMLLLIDKVLRDNVALENDIKNASAYSTINIQAETGITIDYIQRTALFYHNYVLQPWIEIDLISHCCRGPIDKSFHFLIKQIRLKPRLAEFSHSSAKIDAIRAQHGFKYAQKNSLFDKSRIAPTIVAYYTGRHDAIPPDLMKIVQQRKSSPWLSFLLARKALWP